MNDKLGKKIVKKFVGIRDKTYSPLIDDVREDKKAKSTKMCVIKRKLKFEGSNSTWEQNKLSRKKYIDSLRKNDKKFIRNN